MSKFKNIDVNGNNNVVGENNVQNNQVTNNHYHNNRGSSSSDGGEIIVIGVGILVAFGALIWWFFNNINQIYYYLNIAALSSPILGVLAISILVWANIVTWKDVFRFICSLSIGLCIFGFAILAREHAPEAIIKLSSQVEFRDFWERLNDKGEAIVISNFAAALLIALSSVFAHLMSLRQFAYALANPNRVGFWYGLYNSSSLFASKVSVPIVAFFLGIVWGLLSGHIQFPKF